MAITGTSSFESGHGSNFVIDGNNVEFDLTADGSESSVYAGWFYVKLSGVDGTTPAITINNPDPQNPEPSGVYPVYSYDQVTWYSVTSTWTSGTGELTFSLPAISGHSDVWIAAQQPYTYTDLLADIAVWDDSSYVTLEDLGDSQSGRNIYYIKINDSSSTKTKVIISITARCHPGEPCGSWQLKGMIDWILSSDSLAQKLRKFCTLHIFPMVNPDGVYAGTNTAYTNGVNANRDYDESGPDSGDESAETFLIHTKLAAINTATAIYLHLDLHGSYEYPNIYYDSTEWGSAWLKTRIENNMVEYDTNDFWYPTFVDHSHGSLSVNTTWADGVYDQYGIKSLMLEGCFLGYDDFGFPSAASIRDGGKVFLKSVLSIFAYNDLSGLTSLVNLWNFENGALGTDSGPGSDDLTVLGDGAVVASYIAPNQKYGSKSLNVDGSNDALYITDANLSTGHPWKSGSSGDWYISGWQRFDTITNQQAIGITKYNTVTGYRSIRLLKLSSTESPYHCLAVYWGNSDGSGYTQYNFDTALTFAAARWYHIEIKYDESELKLYARVWDDTAKAYLGGTSSWYSVTVANAMYRSSAILSIGATVFTTSDIRDDVDGNMDEWILGTTHPSDSEFELMRQGLYGIGNINIIISNTTNSIYTLARKRQSSCSIPVTSNKIITISRIRQIAGVVSNTFNAIFNFTTETIVYLTAILENVFNSIEVLARKRQMAATVPNVSDLSGTINKLIGLSVNLPNTSNAIFNLLSTVIINLAATFSNTSNISTQIARLKQLSSTINNVSNIQISLQKILSLLAIIEFKSNFSATLSTSSAITADTQNIYGFISAEGITASISDIENIYAFIEIDNEIYGDIDAG